MFPPTKKKKLGESVGFGGESSAPPKYSASGGMGSDKTSSGGDNISKENDSQEPPAAEAAFHSGSSSPVATPESVNYRTEAQTCQACEYMQGTDCSFLRQPVAAGDSCNRFENKSEDMGASVGAGAGGSGMMGEDTMNAGGY